jgi:hypothetical protein
VDYSLIALLGLIALVVVGSNRSHRRTWSGRPGYQYQRVITAGVFGLWLTIAGAIGWDLSHLHGFVQGTKWVDGPIWWQIGLGGALLAVAVFLARRIPPDATRSRGFAETRR